MAASLLSVCDVITDDLFQSFAVESHNRVNCGRLKLRLTAGSSIKCFSLAAVSGISENVKIKTNM